MTDKNYEDMSREELMSMAGIEDDANMSRDELISMAKKRSEGGDMM